MSYTRHLFSHNHNSNRNPKLSQHHAHYLLKKEIISGEEYYNILNKQSKQELMQMTRVSLTNRYVYFNSPMYITDVPEVVTSCFPEKKKMTYLKCEVLNLKK